MRFLSSLTAAMQSGVHSNGMSFPKSRVMGAVIEENLVINMRWYPKTPMNERAPLRVVMFSRQARADKQGLLIVNLWSNLYKIN